MMSLLTTFAALSMVGTVLLSLLPEGGIKRTAGMAVGVLVLLCWAEGLSALLGLDLFVQAPASVLSPTAVHVQEVVQAASTQLEAQWEGMP